MDFCDRHYSSSSFSLCNLKNYFFFFFFLIVDEDIVCLFVCFLSSVSARMCSESAALSMCYCDTFGNKRFDGFFSESQFLSHAEKNPIWTFQREEMIPASLWMKHEKCSKIHIKMEFYCISINFDLINESNQSLCEKAQMKFEVRKMFSD